MRGVAQIARAAKFGPQKQPDRRQRQGGAILFVDATDPRPVLEGKSMRSLYFQLQEDFDMPNEEPELPGR